MWAEASVGRKCLPLKGLGPSIKHMTAPKDILRNVPIFKDLDEAELDAVAEVCKEEKHESGAYVFREGEAGTRLYVIASGEARISRDVDGSGEEAVGVLKPGALFGWMSVFERSARSTHAIANGGCTLLTITRHDFEMLLDFNRELAYKVFWACVRVLLSRLRSTNDSLRS